MKMIIVFAVVSHAIFPIDLTPSMSRWAPPPEKNPTRIKVDIPNKFSNSNPTYLCADFFQSSWLI